MTSSIYRSVQSIFNASIIVNSVPAAGAFIAVAAIAATFICAPTHAQAYDPVISAWRVNLTGAIGFNNLDADVQQVRYSSTYVYYGV